MSRLAPLAVLLIPFAAGRASSGGETALENVANLDRLPTRGFEVIALPMKVRGGSGPLRIVARVPVR